MSSQPHWAPRAAAGSYAPDDPEAALKFAIRHHGGDRVQIVEGLNQQVVPPTWGHEKAAAMIRRQIDPVAQKMGCLSGSGNLDLPGSDNWYVPDLAVVPEDLAEADALVPHQTLLVVEVTSQSNGDTDRFVKRRRYAEYGAPLYLLVGRQERSCTLYAEPGELGYRVVEGPHPFGTPLRLPEPFGLELDTADF
ncbi:Uma2 family endonuclease [Actinacidiphila sp. bgisy160]|uniref:Uma2 family endonuclease n=1 Tax=Actinacidiphila sp. bgisy160 TaxID=3413796 RepID=UPI003D74AF2D